MLEWMQDLDLAGRRVLDLGTGTGILAFAAAHLGARQVTAVEPDPRALQNARENRERNRLSKSVELALGDCATAPGVHDLVLANLLAPILRQSAQDIAARLAPGGHLLCSGILHDQEEPVRQALEAAGLRHVEGRRNGAWSAQLLSAPPSLP
jgi:ribosomal protein L11 methyltransferase